MKKIGFIDYYISEWHANNYPKWIKAAAEDMGLDMAVCYACAELDTSPTDGVTTDEWCEREGVVKCNTIEQLCEVSDYICILAPSNPEKHLELCERAFKCGKRTYVDKTFAPDLKTAREIFALSKKYGTPFFSTSALRYAAELSGLEGAENLVVTGTGSNFDEYFIHIAEIAIKLLGVDILAVKATPQGKNQCTVFAEFGSGKHATLVFSPSMPYSVCAEFADGGASYEKIEGGYFAALIKDILAFYDSGEVPFDGEETLAVMKLREAAICSRNAGGERIEL